MSFILFVVEPRGQRATVPDAEMHRLYDAMMAYTADLQARGILLRAESLRTDDHAVRIHRPRNHTEPLALDGPFAEAKEMIGGFFLIDVATRDEAVAVARQCPAIDWASIEVRECAPCHDR